MSDELWLSHSRLSIASKELTAAARSISSRATAPPRGRLASLNSIGDEVAAYLECLRTARSALAGASDTAAGAAETLKQQSSDLDTKFAAVFGSNAFLLMR